MKKLFIALVILIIGNTGFSQLVSTHGADFISENANSPVVDIEQIGRLITVASIEDGTIVVRRFYRGKWEQIGESTISGIKKAVKLDLYNHKNTPYVFCYYDNKMSVIRSMADVWETVGEVSFGSGNITDPEFAIIGEKPYIVYEDADYEMLRMISLLDNSWYDVDLISTEEASDYKIAANIRGDLFMAYTDGSAINFKKVNQTTEISEWPSLTKPLKIENINEIFDFEFIDNKAYLTYPNEMGSPVIISLEDAASKWETLEELETKSTFGGKDINLVISEYFFFTANSKTIQVAQFLKNNKKGNWGNVTNLSARKTTCVASTEYNRVIYVALIEVGTNKLIVKKIEKGEDDDKVIEQDSKSKKKK